ncbi:TPA_asm: Large T antigen [Steenbok polyomavirus]|nr:TPA_asm: Large T antigen [Steenbok polyomavirus]
MEKVLMREEAKELLGLLGLPHTCWGNVPLMKKKLAEARRKYHPDKGGDNETMARLNDLWAKAAANLEQVHASDPGFFAGPKYGEEGWEEWWAEWNREYDEERLRCEEDLHSSEEEEPGPSTPRKPSQSQQSQESDYTTPPKKARPPPPEDIPAALLEYVSQAVFGNKTYCAFCVYTTETKVQDMQLHCCRKFNPLFWCISTVDDRVGGAVFFMICPGKHRVTAVLNWGRKICASSFIHVKAVLKQGDCYARMGEAPFSRVSASKEGGLHDEDFEEKGSKGKEVDWVKLCEFAHCLNSTDPLLIMGMYLDFAAPPGTCVKCNSQSGGKIHWKNHPIHHANAKIFKQCKQQKNICSQAADQVAAAARLRVHTSTRAELLEYYMKQHFVAMAEQCGGPVEIATTMAGVAWLSELIPDCNDQVLSILEMLVLNTPKSRYVHFIGPVNSGKTTLAAAITNFVNGVSLNINVPSEKLPFELGCAQDKFCVLFEDVKGQATENLPGGMGFINLDNMRDYLDGCVPVNLEKKHQNKVCQLWPPGIITSNEYNVPKTVSVRVHKTIRFKYKKSLEKALRGEDNLLSKRILTNPVTLLAMLVWNEPVSRFAAALQEDVVHWKTVLEAWISFSTFMEMRVNCQEGRPVLQGVVVYDDEEEDTQQTGESGYSGSFT